MGLKPDNWIRKMALEHRMIEPFVDTQVRSGVISYGVSSYGYDIRVADEFKIFTNVFSAVVDPKHFDPRGMVDFKGDVCRLQGRCVCDPAELVCACQDGRVLPHPA